MMGHDGIEMTTPQRQQARLMAQRYRNHFYDLQHHREVIDACIKEDVPLKFREAETDSQVAHGWIKDLDGLYLFIYGPYGVGKSHIAWALVREHFKTMFDRVDRGGNAWGKFEGGQVGKWLNTLNPFNIPEEDRGGGGCRDPRIKAEKCELLLLDDLGGEVFKDWRLETLNEVINTRYENCLPTIITSNMQPPELKKVEGFGRIVDRISESVTVISLEGESLRPGIAS